MNKELNKNNFSYWYPKIKDCALFKVPKSKIFYVPEKVQKSFYCNDSGLPYEVWNKSVDEWIEQEVLPFVKEKGFVFNKNAVFSDKFDFNNCISNINDIKGHILNINYNSLVVGAGGLDELVLREVIGYEHEITPCIYNGLPLRSEFRCFYDFDTKELLYTVNYWDYDYCVKSMSYNATDRIIFDHEKARLETNFNKHKSEVEDMIKKSMKDIELQDKWSIDILMDEIGDFWLIDMALAKNSAYWNRSRLREEGVR